MLDLLPQFLKALSLPVWMVIASSLLARLYKVYRERSERRLKLQKEQLDAIRALCGVELASQHPLQVEEITHFAYGGVIGKAVVALAYRSASPARFLSDYLKARRFVEVRDGRLVPVAKFRDERTRRKYMKRNNMMYYCFSVAGAYPLFFVPVVAIHGNESVLMPLCLTCLSLLALGFLCMDSYFRMSAAVRLLDEAAEENADSSVAALPVRAHCD